MQGIVERKNSIPILSNVLAEAEGGELRISATDLDVSAALRLHGRGDGRGRHHPRGQEALRDRALAARGRRAAQGRCPTPGPPSTCERVSFKMAGLPREDFPALPEGKAKGGVEMPADVLRELIARTAFAITAEDARYYLAGALLVLDKDGAAMVATDGHRLSYAAPDVA